MREALQLLESSLLLLPFAFMLGLIWGSFFNVCIYRLPAGQSVAKHRSRCPHCAHPIAWYHNIPIASYLWLRAQCVFCRRHISMQYPLVELATGILFVWLTARNGLTLHLINETVFLSSLLVISVIDFHHRIIPDELSLSGIVIGFLFNCFLPTVPWQESLLGAGLGGGIFFAVAYGYEKFTGREGLGGGDVKMLAMIGAWLGWRSLLPVIILSTLLGSLVGLVVMWTEGKGLKTAIPFGPFLAAAAALYLAFREPLEMLLYPSFE